MNGVSTSTLTTSTAATYSSPGTEKSYSRLGLNPPTLATQHEVEGSTEGGSNEANRGSDETRMGHEGKDGSEVTVKARAVVPTPARYAAPAVSTGMGYGYSEPVSPRRDGMPASPGPGGQVWSYLPAQVAQTRSPTQPMQVPSRSPTQPIPVPQGQPLSRSPPNSRSPPKSRSPPQPSGPRTPPARSPTRPTLNQQPPSTPPKQTMPPATPPKQSMPPSTPPNQRGAYPSGRPVPMPIPGSGSPLGLGGVQGLGSPHGRAGVQGGRGGFGEADDPLAMHAAELMKGVNGSPGTLMPGASFA